MTCYVRHFRMKPLVISIWSRVDVEELRKKAVHLPCIQDATASIATNQKRDREIHYRAYKLCDQSVKIEPAHFLKILRLSRWTTSKYLLRRIQKGRRSFIWAQKFVSPYTCCAWFFMASFKQDIMLFCSLLANTSTLEVFEYVLQNFFTILLFQLETEILQKSHATSFSDAENMTDFKTLLKFENEEQVREFLENEKNEKRWRPNRNKFNERWPP